MSFDNGGRKMQPTIGPKHWEGRAPSRPPMRKLEPRLNRNCGRSRRRRIPKGLRHVRNSVLSLDVKLRQSKTKARYEVALRG